MTSKNHANYPGQYLKVIKSGNEVVSKKIRITYEYFVDVLPNKEDCEWEYRDDLALHAIDFIEKYAVTLQGQVKPLKLMLFQKAAISLIFGWVRKGTTERKHRIVHFHVGRKNGKSALAAAIALYLMFSDGEFGGELYSVATKKEQAKIIWDAARKMINRSKTLRSLSKTRVSDIEALHNTTVFKALASDSNSLDGLNTSGAFMDEIHAWKDMNLYDVIVDSTSARDNWLVLLTTTAGFVRGLVWDRFYEDAKNQINSYAKGEELDERVLFLVYELDERKEWTDEKAWNKANPALGIIKEKDELRRKVEAAKVDDLKVKNLLTKEFNIPETGSDYWLNLEDIINDTKLDFDKETKEFIITDYLVSGDKTEERTKRVKAKYGIGGFDLSQTTDLTCATAMFKVENDDRIFMKQMYWIPQDLLSKRIEEDKVRYDIWQHQGLLRTCEGNVINYKDVKDWFVEMQEEYDLYFFKVGYDAWSAQYLVDDMSSYFGSGAMEEVRQGVRSLSSPMYQMGSDLKAKRIVYDANPIFEWCTTNVRVDPDKNGNIQPMKNRNDKVRIDGFAAALNAYVVMERNKENYEAMIGVD